MAFTKAPLDLSTVTGKKVVEFLGCVGFGDALQCSQNDFADAICVL